MQNIHVKFNGITPLLQNNSQVVDPFNRYAKAKKPLTAKRSKTDDDIQKIRDLEVESKLYFNDELGVYVPGSWLSASIAANAYSVAKVSKAKTRGAIFIVEDKAKLYYDGIEMVEKIKDIVHNDHFIKTMILPQKGVRLAKAAPIFHRWSFSFNIEYDDSVLDEAQLVSILEYSAKYNGFGDFRPTYGRATLEVLS